MVRSSKTFLVPAGALILGCGLFGLASVHAQETKTPEEPANDQVQVAVQTGLPEESGSATEESTPRVSEGGGEPDDSGNERKHHDLLPGSTAPPTNLKFVRDHWTPWDPPDPESFPADSVLHIIARGETLWDLAELAFGDPYLWPQIWNQNRYILDSHWIYPGDPLLLPRRPTVVTQIMPRGQTGAPPMDPAPMRDDEEVEDDVEPIRAPLTAARWNVPTAAASGPTGRAPDEAHAPRVARKPMPLASETDIRCGGYIARKDTKPDYFIANQEEPGKVGLTEGDIIYLNRGRNNGHVEPGTEYSIIVRDGEVHHPVTNKRLGNYYKRLGTVTLVMEHEDTAIGRISMACGEIRTGYDLVSLEVTPVMVAKAPPFDRLDVLQSGKPTGYVVHTMDYVALAGTGHLVEIDLGYEDGLESGDFLTIYLPKRPYDSYMAHDYDFDWSGYRVRSPKIRKSNLKEYPPRIIGQMMVLTTEKRTSSAKIIHAIREVHIGTMVEVN